MKHYMRLCSYINVYILSNVRCLNSQPYSCLDVVQRIQMLPKRSDSDKFDMDSLDIGGIIRLHCLTLKQKVP